MNLIYGLNIKTGMPYWWVSGISLGDTEADIQASKYLMDHWKLVMSEQVFVGQPTHFEYIGAALKKGKNKDPFCDCRLLHEKWAGLHCLTANIKK